MKQNHEDLLYDLACKVPNWEDTFSRPDARFIMSKLCTKNSWTAFLNSGSSLREQLLALSVRRYLYENWITYFLHANPISSQLTVDGLVHLGEVWRERLSGAYRSYKILDAFSPLSTTTGIFRSDMVKASRGGGFFRVNSNYSDSGNSQRKTQSTEEEFLGKDRVGGSTSPVKAVVMSIFGNGETSNSQPRSNLRSGRQSMFEQNRKREELARISRMCAVLDDMYYSLEIDEEDWRVDSGSWIGRFSGNMRGLVVGKRRGSDAETNDGLYNVIHVDNEKEYLELLNKQLEFILSSLKNYTEHCSPFLTKVLKRDAPDYHKIIAEPMDLGTMTRKLEREEYLNRESFLNDLQLIYNNCREYNIAPGNVFTVHANAMEERTKEIVSSLPTIKLKPVADRVGEANEDLFGSGENPIGLEELGKNEAETSDLVEEDSYSCSSFWSDILGNEHSQLIDPREDLFRRLTVVERMYWMVYRKEQNDLKFEDRFALFRTPQAMDTFIKKSNSSLSHVSPSIVQSQRGFGGIVYCKSFEAERNQSGSQTPYWYHEDGEENVGKIEGLASTLSEQYCRPSVNGRLLSAKDYRPFFPEITSICGSVPDICLSPPPLYPKTQDGCLSIKLLCAPVSSVGGRGNDMLANVDSLSAIKELKKMIEEEHKKHYIVKLIGAWKVKEIDEVSAKNGIGRRGFKKKRRSVRNSDGEDMNKECKEVRVNGTIFKEFNSNPFVRTGSFSFLNDLPFNFSHMNSRMMKHYNPDATNVDEKSIGENLVVSEAILSEDIAMGLLGKGITKTLQHTGFDSVSEQAQNVLCESVANFISTIGKLCRVNLDKVERVNGEKGERCQAAEYRCSNSADVEKKEGADCAVKSKEDTQGGNVHLEGGVRERKVTSVLSRSLYEVGVLQGTQLVSFYADEVLLFGKQLCLVENLLQKEYFAVLLKHCRDSASDDDIDLARELSVSFETRIEAIDSSFAKSFSKDKIDYTIEAKKGAFVRSLKTKVNLQKELIGLRQKNLHLTKEINIFIRRVEFLLECKYSHDENENMDSEVNSIVSGRVTPQTASQNYMEGMEDYNSEVEGLRASRKRRFIASDEGDNDQGDGDSNCSVSKPQSTTGFGSDSKLSQEASVHSTTPETIEDSLSSSVFLEKNQPVKYSIDKSRGGSVLKISLSQKKDENQVKVEDGSRNDDSGTAATHKQTEEASVTVHEPLKRRSSSRIRSPSTRSMSESAPSTPHESRKSSPGPISVTTRQSRHTPKLSPESKNKNLHPKGTSSRGGSRQQSKSPPRQKRGRPAASVRRRSKRT
eukprot:Nk52_evm64s217 gene=Nk52_evmTU64s217